MNRFVTLLVLVLLTGCSNTPTQSYPALKTITPVHLTKKQLAVIQRDVQQSLKDPESARFGTIIGGRDSMGITTACGFVNAKNSFGGYTGKQPFIGILVSHETGFVVAAMGGTSSETTAVLIQCQNMGLSI